jgi:hypothetical protein
MNRQAVFLSEFGTNYSFNPASLQNEDKLILTREDRITQNERDVIAKRRIALNKRREIMDHAKRVFNSDVDACKTTTLEESELGRLMKELEERKEKLRRDREAFDIFKENAIYKLVKNQQNTLPLELKRKLTGVIDYRTIFDIEQSDNVTEYRNEFIRFEMNPIFKFSP